MSTLDLPGLEVRLEALGLGPIPQFSHAHVLNNPLDIGRSYLADILGKFVGCDPTIAYNSIKSPKNIFNGDLAVPLPKLFRGSDWNAFRDVIKRFPSCPLFYYPFLDGVLLRICFTPNALTRLLLPYINDRNDLYGKDPSIGLRDAFSTGLGRKKLVIEFSSPNIVNELESKHVRSTILGACIANLYESMGWDVVKINYLGDWGMQMGLLGVGWEKFGSEEEFRADPVRHMFSIYSKIDKVFQSEVVARRVAFEDGLDTLSIETQGLFAERNAFFRRIQDGDDEAPALWKRFRDVTIEHYSKLYARFNVRFDEYSGESQVSLESMGEVEEMLKSKGISEESDGAWIVDLEKHRLRGGGIATIRSRNQNRTYLLRDLAAVLDRSRRYSFDRMIYVVADDHYEHFRRLFHILELLNMHDVAHKLEHVRFNKGRQMGHENTSGDIFDQCLNSMHESLVANPDKAALLHDSEYPVADLGISALVAQELSVKRGTDYHFDFLKMALFEGATGPNLQYWYSRLCSMLKATSFDLSIVSDEDFTRVKEGNRGMIGIDLLRVLAQYPSITSSAYKLLDPSIVIHYLVQITDHLSCCIEDKKSLEEPIVTPAEAALLESTRQVLENGMKLLGIMPSHGVSRVPQDKTEHPNVSIRMANVAPYWNQGAVHDAEELGVHVTKVKKSTPDGEHPDVLSDVDSDTTDISSDMESVLSIVAPTVSSKTSIQGEISLFAADEIISLLLEDEELRVFFTEAIQSDRVGPARFERNLRRLLNQYSADLKKEAESNEEKAAVYLIRSRSRYLANDIRKKFTSGKDSDRQYEILKKRSDHKINSSKAVERYLAESTPISQTARVEDSTLRRPANFLSGDSENDAEGNETQSEGANSDSDFEENSADDDITESQNYEKLPKLSMVKTFMVTSTAFSMFRRNLQQFIQPPSRSEICRLLAKLSRPERNNSIPESSKAKLRILVTDLDFISPCQIRISYQETSSFSNHLKGIVEDLTKETWEWWPLKPRMRPLPPGHARLRWDCSCGEARWEDVPTPVARRIAHLTQQKPASSETCSPTALRMLAGPTAKGTRIGQTEPSSTIPNSQSTSDVYPKYPPRVSAASNNNVKDGEKGYVLFGVTTGEDFQLAQIEVQHYKDDQFFDQLREKYNEFRGFFRKWFGIWKYSHSEFVKFEKIGDNDIVPRGPGIPDPSNRDYQYNPRPAEHLPPISPHEFRRRFYACHSRCSILRVARLRPFHKCWRPCRHSSEALDRIPKKNKVLEAGGDGREFFWGIHGIERLSFLSVASYHLLILLPPLIFWFLWLFQWGHSGDMQNASVPFLSALGLLSLFWLPLINK